MVWISTAAPSASMSASATRTTELSAADSFSCGAASGAFLASSLAGGPAGTPSGNAVLNLPVIRTPSGRLLFDGSKPFIAVSPESEAMMESTNMLLGDECMSSDTLSPAAGLISNAPENARSMVSIWLVATSSRLSAVRLSVRTVGVKR